MGKWDVSRKALNETPFGTPEWDTLMEKLHNVPARIRSRIRHMKWKKADLDEDLLNHLHYHVDMGQAYIDGIPDDYLDICLEFIFTFTNWKRGTQDKDYW